ncbi:heterokaryon incompatibility protein-domain-containing protein [Xylariomycetidae sp. FL2044]|nr:heterokaryon incompatibility protein-domain-containing protein [Xylariomycetidae sp. FL2044]
MSSRLRYHPLGPDEFRLATLLPPSASDPTGELRLELFHSSLSVPKATYMALSYTWQSRLDSDDDDETGEAHDLIVVNGHEVPLHTNLVAALRGIRTDTAQCIWADALCIDQTNMPERSSQVMLMREIFSRASHVYAWLGREAKNSNLAVDFLAELSQFSDNEEFEQWWTDTALQPSHYPVWEALRCFMNRHWWSRAWIVQEFALAPKVVFICGDRRLSATQFAAANRLIFVHFSSAKNRLVTVLRQFVPIHARNLLDLRHRLQSGERISALASLQMTRLSLATDPRDHLFAKLGLSGRELADLAPPNYEIDAEESWFAFLSTYIKQKKDLYIICLAGMQPRGYRHLPSWLPDWGPSKPTYPLCSISHEDQPQWPYFDAANGTTAVATMSTDKLSPDNVLSCRGLQFDVVDGVAGDRWAAEPTVMCQSKSRNKAYETRLEIFEALCRTVTANTNRLGDWGPPPREFRAIFAKRWQELKDVIEPYERAPTETALPLQLYPTASGFERTWRSTRELEVGGEAIWTIVEDGLANELATTSTLKHVSGPETTEIMTAASHPLWTALEHSAGQACFDRFVFVTEKGYIGLGPATVKPGDRVAVLMGCKVPVLLRPDRHWYRMIGEAYVDGIMYGEALRDSLTVASPETFDIY